MAFSFSDKNFSSENKVSCVTFYDLIFHRHPPVIAPPTKANPRDEAKAAACMVTLPLKTWRREGRGLRSYICSILVFLCICKIIVWLWPLPIFFPWSYSHNASQAAQNARHTMQIVDSTGVLDAQVGWKDGLQRRRKGILSVFSKGEMCILIQKMAPQYHYIKIPSI